MFWREEMMEKGRIEFTDPNFLPNAPNEPDTVTSMTIKPKRILIGLNGVARSGKDTVGKMLCDNYGFKRLAFADSVRQGVYEINPLVTSEQRVKDIVDEIGWEEAKTEYPEIRELLQRYGTEGGRLIHGEDCWVSIIEKVIKNNPHTKYVITDMRFENEIALVKQLRGTSVQIQNARVKSINGHVSDKVLPSNLFTEIIENHGTLEELKSKVDDLMLRLKRLSVTNVPVTYTGVLTYPIK